MHLDQIIGGVVYEKCSCKAGQGGCCKRVAALFYTILDYNHTDVKEVPRDLTCTQVGHKWHVPSVLIITQIMPSNSLTQYLRKQKEGKKTKKAIVNWIER